MDDLQLSDTLQRYFSDVFLCCDEDNSGKASLTKTIELIQSGSVPEDVISQISDICWALGSNYLNKKQFFSALKLVAAYQANIPVRSEVLTSKVELPLPRFTWTVIDNKSPIGDLIELRHHPNDYTEQVDTASTDSEIESETVRNGSPDMSSATSDSPTPTNSVQDRSWVVSGVWHGLISEEQRQLLGTEEESSEKHSSEEDTEVSSEVWTITNEQREYYTNQFRSLQPDTNALLAGPIARTFFEKSRLPIHELRKIWQLADVTKDGALSLQEFNTAMHLVVLRRNHIELPDVLPPTLVPGNETPLSVSPETEPILSPQTKDTAKEWTKFIDSPTSSVSSPGPKPVNFDFQKVTLDKDSKILHPVPLRLTPEVASNNHVEDQTDGMDLHSPKKFSENALSQNLQNLNIGAQNSAIQRPQAKKINIPGPGAIPPPPPNNQNNAEEGPVSLPAFPPPKKEKPPPPPPRPFKTHGRSSSLDLNRLSKLGAPPTVPPRISPNIQGTKKLINQRSEGDSSSHAEAFANFEQFEFEKYENVSEGIFRGDVYEAERKKLFAQFSQPSTSEEAPRKHGAFEIYRKPQVNSSPVSQEDKAKWQLFQQLQEENTVLLRICQELSQELAELREEKLTLKVRLEKQLSGG
ncbi:ralBP1-associated Eps domain-containing protein 1 [Diorhabda carinulata]|uniref:ralBP1-associated Eps domain-containing protein 1 n=1 Tax=Diorhabda carinulata TaxID=1163345 RepID=UPI0025A0CE61|nr:ralBP1-associated Eps domain-containing protein 1 [Diorhabda carinulata]